MDFGAQLKKYRKKSKFTQQELAKESGISRTYLSDVENNRYKPSVSFIKKVSDTLSTKFELQYDEKKNLFDSLMISAGYSMNEDEILLAKSKIKKWDDNARIYISNYVDNNLISSTPEEIITLAKYIELLKEYSNNQEFIIQFQLLFFMFITNKEKIEQANDTELEEIRKNFQDNISKMIDSIRLKEDK